MSVVPHIWQRFGDELRPEWRLAAIAGIDAIDARAGAVLLA
jgi:hypothetical protein